MKKIISILCAITVLFSLVSFTALATDVPNKVNSSPITISEDYRTLSTDGYTYSRFNSDMLFVQCNDAEENIVLSETQKETVEKVEIESSEKRQLMSARIFFKDGAMLSVTFLRDDYREEYDKLSTDKTVNFEIDFNWPEENIVTARGKDLFGEVVTLDSDILEKSDAFDVMVSNKDKTLEVLRGALLIWEENYYYVDYSESNVKEGRNYHISQYPNLKIHKVKDKALIEKLDNAKSAYYSDGLGFFENDELSEKVSMIFFLVVFAFLTLIILITFLILAIRSKGVYKKMHRITYILCGVELLLFTTIALIMVMAKG